MQNAVSVALRQGPQHSSHVAGNLHTDTAEPLAQATNFVRWASWFQQDCQSGFLIASLGLPRIARSYPGCAE